MDWLNRCRILAVSKEPELASGRIDNDLPKNREVFNHCEAKPMKPSRGWSMALGGLLLAACAARAEVLTVADSQARQQWVQQHLVARP